MKENLVIVRGGGDIATGTIVRLYNSGFKVAILEIEKPTVIRRTVAFAQGVYSGETEVEGIRARRVEAPEEALEVISQGEIPIIIDKDAASIDVLEPEIVIDAILAKRNFGTHMDMAPIVIGLGPGFEAGKDVHAVIETNRGHNLGRVIYSGPAEANTGIPGNIGGFTKERVIWSPASGRVKNIKEIGDMVKKGEIIGYVNDTEVLAPLDGVIRGLIIEGIEVTKGFKIGDVDPRGRREYCFTISDKARAIGGGVLEGILHLRIRDKR